MLAYSRADVVTGLDWIEALPVGEVGTGTYRASSLGCGFGG
jgi:hypothetical protein